MSEYVTVWVDDLPDLKRGEEIVRCRDCVFFAADYSTVDLSGNVIATGNLCEWTELWVKPIDFCSQGERRGDAE